MTEVPGAGEDAGEAAPTRKVGWYRDRNTGKRQFWNGVSWIDVAGAVTAFTVEPPRRSTPAQAHAVGPGNARDRQLKALVGAGAVLVVVAAVVLGVVLSNKGTTAPRRATSPTVVPADTPASSPSASTTPSVSGSFSTTTIGSVTGAGGVPASTTASPTSAPHSIVLVGDSITVRAGPDIEHVLRGYRVIFDAVDGSTMAQHLATIDGIEAKGGPFDWIVELGTNDAGLANANWASDFSNEVSALESQPCVVFVTVNSKLGPISTGIDAAITTAVALHPNFRALDWGNIEFRKPHWLTADGIHPTKSGEAELARLVHKAVLGCSA